MFAVKYFVKIESFSLKVNIPLWRKHIEVRPFRIVHALSNLISFYYFVRVFTLPKRSTIFGVLTFIAANLATLLNLIDFQMTCFCSNDASSSEHLDDRVMLGLFGMKYILRLLTACVIYLEKQSAEQAMNTWGKVLSSTRLMEAVISKHLVAKQLKDLRTLAESATFLDRVVSDVREVIKGDCEINRAYGVIAGTTAVCSYLRSILIIYMAWIMFGLREHIDEAFEGDMLASIIFYIAVCSPSVLLGFYCSFVTDEIEELKFELDVTMTARKSNKRQQEMISSLLRELHNKNVNLSPLGLFTISRASLAAVTTTTVSYMLVLIQFS